MFRNIVITGASSGLGEVLALHYSNPDVTLGLTGRNPERLARVAGDCRRKGAVTETALIDVQQRNVLESWLLQFDDRHPVDLIIANAGVLSSVSSNHLGESLEAIADIININFIGAIASVNPLLERMRDRRRGSIAVISSLSAYRGIPRMPAYAASKSALKSYFEAIRPVCASNNIAISVVCPSYIMTPMNNRGASGIKLSLSADRAAEIIETGINKKAALIVFPYSHLLGIRLLQLLPEKLSDYVLYKLLRL